MTAPKTPPAIDPDRLAALDRVILRYASHDDPAEGMCAMEAAAWVAGEPHSDHPQCACPVIAAFVRRWNDSLPDDETRTRLLRPLVPRLVGSRSTAEVEERRAWLATDWMIRVLTPAFLEISPGLREHARALSGLPPVLSREAAAAAQPTVDEARRASSAAWAAAWAAARAAARDAAWAAASAAARAAASAAARAAAWAAAGAAARDAARDAASAAAWAAAGNAAGDAAWDALRPTVERLQASALELLERMLAVQLEAEAQP